MKGFDKADRPVKEEDKNNDDSAQARKGQNWLKTFLISPNILLLCICFLLLLVVLLIALIANNCTVVKKFEYDLEQETLRYHRGIDNTIKSSEQNQFTSPKYFPEILANHTSNEKLKIISRLEWIAEPPLNATPLNLPIPFVVILHTATRSCLDQDSCTFLVRSFQQYHIEHLKWWDISYNFLVGGDGYIYEGRGWQTEGAFAYGFNSRAIGIAFIGTFNNILPTNRQIAVAKELIEEGVKKNYISKNYKLFAHRQLTATLSPGEELFKNVKTWPHWAVST